MTAPIEMRDDASVAQVRECVRSAGTRCGMEHQRTERVALAASELAHNVLKHAIDGTITVSCIERGGVRGIEIVSRDAGPGMADPTAAVRGRMATSGLGMGVGIVRRQTDELDVETRKNAGTRIAARTWVSRAEPHVEYGLVGRPHPAERDSGDDAVVVRFENGLLAAVIDGLGHGPAAHEAARRAVRSIADNASMRLDALLEQVHRDLIGTRGAAASVARVNERSRTIEFAGIGNVGVRMHYRGWNDVFLPRPGVLGTPAQHRLPTVREHDFPDGAAVLMYTDGISTREGFEDRELVLPEHPVVAADWLIQQRAKKTDDALVLVIR